MIKPTLQVVQQIASLRPGLADIARLAAHVVAPNPAPPTALIKWGNYPVMDDEWIGRAARFDFLAFTPGVWENNMDKARLLRLKNPDIMLGHYVSLHTLPRWMEDGRPGSYVRKWWDTLRPHLLKDDNGEVISFFRNQPAWDFLDPSVRAKIIPVIADHAIEHQLDWLFLDFASSPMPDWDGGTTWTEEQQETMTATWFAYIQELRDAMPGVRLIANGTLGVYDDDFAALLDGVWLEDFLQWTPTRPLSVLTLSRYRNGDGFTFLGNPYSYHNLTDLAKDYPPLCSVGYFQTGDVMPPQAGKKG